MTKTELELLIKKKFSVLFQPGESLALMSDPNTKNINLSWARCSITEKGICLLIETDSTASPFKRQNSVNRKTGKGPVFMEEVKLQENGREMFFIAVYCRKKILERLFERLAADLVLDLYENFSNITDPWDRLRERLEGWRLLFSFSDKEIIEQGLLGELIIFKFLREKLGITPSAWTGPLNGSKDFMLKGLNCEVKTTTVKYGYFVQVAGLFQTRQDETLEKLIFIRLEKRPNGDFSISQLINDILSILNESDKVTFKKLLDNFDEDILLSKNSYSVLEISFFTIDDKFPRISSDSFKKDNLPEGIVKIAWTADLGSLEIKNETDFLNVLYKLYAE